ncbi:MAG TPA: hypothetical protein VL122_10610 [Nitrospirota bacterium]|nr:hypothetical protein [Nitrospirota bacterium]
MTTFLRMLVITAFGIALLIVGFAAGFPVGQSSGFATGSEWAIIQADILAREAGVFMPVSFNDGQFRVILKQPGHIYRKAWRLADKYEELMQNEENSEKEPIEVAKLTK